MTFSKDQMSAINPADQLVDAQIEPRVPKFEQILDAEKDIAALTYSDLVVQALQAGPQRLFLRGAAISIDDALDQLQLALVEKYGLANLRQKKSPELPATYLKIIDELSVEDLRAVLDAAIASNGPLEPLFENLSAGMRELAEKVVSWLTFAYAGRKFNRDFNVNAKLYKAELELAFALAMFHSLVLPERGPAVAVVS